METIRQKIEKKNVFRLLWKYFVIAVGSLIYAIGFQFFMYPNAIVSGGVVGVAMIINVFTRLPVGMLTVAMNFWLRKPP